MKSKSFDCVEMKRRAQERIYQATQPLTAEQRSARHEQAFARMKAQQDELRAKSNPSSVR